MEEYRINLISKNNSLKRPLILDGATGSLLQQRNVLTDKNLWSSFANISNPKEVLAIHKEYISAGADIITTNTFRTNPTAIKISKHNFTIEELVKEGVELAIKARADKEILIAGSNASAEDCYQAERTISKYDLEYNHKKHIELLLEYGCDIIWNETQSHWDEIDIICKFCSQNNLPFVINLYFTDELKLLSGEPLYEAVQFIKDYSPQAIGFNCIKPKTFESYYKTFSLNHNWGFYFNCGAGDIGSAIIECGIDPKSYVTPIEPLLKMKPLYVGSCCGSNPEHTKAIKELFDEIY